MTSLLKIVFALALSTVAYADEPLHSCYILRLDKGETLRGPVQGVVLPDRKVTFELTEGMELTGPMVIRLCDGHLLITKP